MRPCNSERWLFEEEDGTEGIQRLYFFPNGYGASVICTTYSYGGSEGLWELAVIRYQKPHYFFNLCYETPITSDVLGHLTEEEVDSLLQQIEELPNDQFIWEE